MTRIKQKEEQVKHTQRVIPLNSPIITQLISFEKKKQTALHSCKESDKERKIELTLISRLECRSN